MSLIGWIISGMIVLLLFICLVFMIRHFHDCPACDITDDKQYRNILCTSARRDFRAVLEQLLEIMDGIRECTKQVVPEAVNSRYEEMNGFYKTAKDIYNKCLQLDKTIREIWTNPKYIKDFYFFAGLHYTSRALGEILAAEQRNLQQFLQACSQAQETMHMDLETLREQEGQVESFEERRELRERIDEREQAIKDLTNQKNKFGEISGIYAERIQRQKDETAKRMDFVVVNFKKLGPEWKQTLSIRPRRQ